MVTTSEFILNFVLNSCWQIAALASVAALAAWLLRNGPARYRHALWVFTLAACLIVPLLTTSRFVPTWISSFQVLAPRTVAVAPGPFSNSSSQPDVTPDHIGSRHWFSLSSMHFSSPRAPSG